MSGQFRNDQNAEIESTDDPELARRFGLTHYDRESGQYTAPTPPDTGERDSGQLAEVLAQNARLSDEIAERDAEIERLKAALAEWGEGGDKGDGGGETPPGFTPAAVQGDGDKDGAPAARRKATGGK